MKNDRTSPEFWKNEAREYAKQAREVDADYRLFCRRFRGDLAEVPYNAETSSTVARSSGFGNLTQLRARIMRGDLMFRCPRPQVAPPRYEKAIFTATLAQVETLLLRDFVEEADYYREMRRAALDLVLAPRCIVKIGINVDGELDLRELRRERAKADAEFKLYVVAGIKPRLRNSDSDATHAVQHAQVIAAAERGELNIPEENIDVMRAHLASHVDRLSDSSRETEASRRGRVTIRRIHPESYSHDVWAERPYDREWHKEAFIERIEDAQADTSYDPEAVKEIVPCHVRRGRRDGSGLTDSDDFNRDSIQTLDGHFQCHEVVDLVESQIVRYAEGGTRPLRVRPWTLAAILPSGPYEEYSLIEDPEQDWGVCPPKVGQDHQEASSELQGIATETVRRGLPMSIINGAVLDEDTIEKIKHGDIAELIVVRNLPPDSDMKKVMASLTPAEVPEQNVGVEQMHRQMAEQILGLGAQREQSSVGSKTATEATIIGNAANSLAEDGGAGWDDFQSRVLRKVARHFRGCYSQRQVVDLVGEIALRPDGWPAVGFADADAGDDRNISVVPGSSRRNESAVLTKMLGEGINTFIVSPLAMTMPATTAELFRRYFESMGQYGLGFDQVGEVATLDMQMQAAQAAAGGVPGDPNAAPTAPPGSAQPGVPPGAPGAAPPQRPGVPPARPGAAPPRPTEATKPGVTGQNNGMANVGGGRMPTGASAGDPPRFMR